MTAPDAPELRVPTSPGPRPRPRPRTRLAAVLVAVALVVVGVAVSRIDAAFADPVGDSLYAAFVVALLVVIAPRARPAAVALVAFGLCTLVELAQLTGLPARAVDAVPLLRYALGTTFAAVDLVAYAAGAALALIVGRVAAVPR
ncbi:DUF2809 domain-containing protein [Cellulomonas fengjieae]|uniref:DUF2809 domain-containing protein n=1 Tax=Cellulomonas fengjieae TaxID=2819978 RepID=UPI001AAF8778|nr:DUF2809 domain-containing protein [Cellulomonas fengjieae]MBO3101030.1 DUF2809 domain-containing protein [Cellulomonas fengjieae]